MTLQDASDCSQWHGVDAAGWRGPGMWTGMAERAEVDRIAAMIRARFGQDDLTKRERTSG